LFSVAMFAQLTSKVPALKHSHGLRFVDGVGFVAQIGCRTFSPLAQTHLSYGLSDRYAKSRVAVEDSDTDLDLGKLPFKVPRHQRLAKQFHTMHPLTGRVMRSMIPRGSVSTRLRR